MKKIVDLRQRARPGIDGTEEELEALLIAGVNSAEIPEEEFWHSVDQTTAVMPDQHKTSAHPRR